MVLRQAERILYLSHMTRAQQFESSAAPVFVFVSSLKINPVFPLPFCPDEIQVKKREEVAKLINRFLPIMFDLSIFSVLEANIKTYCGISKVSQPK